MIFLNGSYFIFKESKVLKDMILDAIEKWEQAAEKTPTPFDDVLVKVIKAILTAVL